MELAAHRQQHREALRYFEKSMVTRRVSEDERLSWSYPLLVDSG